MILVDTGYFIALLESVDDLHPNARAWAAHVREPLLVSEYVLIETINRLSRPRQRPRAHALANAVRTNPQYVFQPADPKLLDAGLLLHANHADKSWSLTDCISFHLMRERGITEALAYDAHFQQAGFVALLRQDPP